VYSAQELERLGTYGALLGDNLLYHQPGRDEGSKLFKGAFPKGFAWEVLEVTSGIVPH